MSKKIILSALLIFAVCSSWAFGNHRVLSASIRGGVNSSDMEFDDFKSFRANIRDRGVGYHAGLSGRLTIPVVGIYLQPELVYSQQSSRLDTGNQKFKTTSLDCPVLVGWKIFFLRLNAGPVFNLDSKTGISSGTSSEIMQSDKPNIGYTGGIGIDFWRLSLEARVYGNFLDEKGQTVHSYHDYKTISRIDKDMTSWSLSLMINF